jgi:hypothetical protein
MTGLAAVNPETVNEQRQSGSSEQALPVDGHLHIQVS